MIFYKLGTSYNKIFKTKQLWLIKSFLCKIFNEQNKTSLSQEQENSLHVCIVLYNNIDRYS